MKLVITFLKLYKTTLSPILLILFGNGCRYTPTCSEYAINVIEKHGIVKGTKLALIRFFKCNPFYKKGVFMVQ